MDKIPTDIICQIFTYISSAQHFALTNKTFLAIARDPGAVSSHLLFRYGHLLVVDLAISRYPYVVNDSVFTLLLNKGATISVSFVQTLAKNGTPPGLSRQVISKLFSYVADIHGSFDAYRSDAIRMIEIAQQIQVVISQNIGYQAVTKLQAEALWFIEKKHFYPTPHNMNALFGRRTVFEQSIVLLHICFPWLTAKLAASGYTLELFIAPETFILRVIEMWGMIVWFERSSLPGTLQEMATVGLIRFDRDVCQKFLVKVERKSHLNWEACLDVFSGMRLPFDPKELAVDHILDTALIFEDNELTTFSIRHLAFSVQLANLYHFSDEIIEALTSLVTKAPQYFMSNPECPENSELMRYLCFWMQNNFANPKLNFLLTFLLDTLVMTMVKSPADSHVMIASYLYKSMIAAGVDPSKHHLDLMSQIHGCENTHKYVINEFLDAVAIRGIPTYDFIRSPSSKNYGVAVLADSVWQVQVNRGSETDSSTQPLFLETLLQWLRKSNISREM